MKIAVASGKGGTGKTTVATNLAHVASQDGRTVGYLDCDVEEPNGALFLKPEITEKRPVNVSIPEVDSEKCNGCGKCGEICQYSAIVVVKGKVLVFPELCHGCGGCWLVCPTGAIAQSYRRTGELELGRTGKIRFVQGSLDVGQAMSPPVIAAVKAAAPDADLLVLDSPPGTSCPVIESVRDADFVLLVTEPTPFGLNDLKLAVEMVRTLKLLFGVVINRSGVGEGHVKAYCRGQGIDVLAEIPDERRVAEAYSRGEMACEAIPEHMGIYRNLLGEIEAAVSRARRRPAG